MYLYLYRYSTVYCTYSCTSGTPIILNYRFHVKQKYVAQAHAHYGARETKEHGILNAHGRAPATCVPIARASTSLNTL